MAATDEFENQLPIQNTGKWIRALDANGSPILIPVEEIAKVVGGLLPITSIKNIGLYPKGHLCFYEDYNSGRKIASIEADLCGIYILSVMSQNKSGVYLVEFGSLGSTNKASILNVKRLIGENYISSAIVFGTKKIIMEFTISSSDNWLRLQVLNLVSNNIINMEWIQFSKYSMDIYGSFVEGIIE